MPVIINELNRETFKNLFQILSRPNDGHKGDFGSACFIGGSQHYTGAAYLAGAACLRSGIGYLHMAVPKSLHPILAGHLPEAIWEPLPELDGFLCLASAKELNSILKNKSAFLIGPGLGLTDSSKAFGLQVLEIITTRYKETPAILDADMLTILSEAPQFHNDLPKNTILTPHPGELARLLNDTVEDIQANRVSCVYDAAAKFNVHVVLKGANTLVASPKGSIFRLNFANSILSHAGSGDVLAGIMLALLSQKTLNISPKAAACFAIWLHAQSGLFALEKHKHAASVLPSDLVQFIGHALADLESD